VTKYFTQEGKRVKSYKDLGYLVYGELGKLSVMTVILIGQFLTVVGFVIFVLTLLTKVFDNESWNVRLYSSIVIFFLMVPVHYSERMNLLVKFLSIGVFL